MQKKLKIIFDKMIFEDIDAIKNYKYFENEKLLVLYIDVATIYGDEYYMLHIPEKIDVENMYEELYDKYSKEYDEDGHLISPEFTSYNDYQKYYDNRWEDKTVDRRINNISNYVTYCLKYVGLRDLKISVYINCEK